MVVNMGRMVGAGYLYVCESFGFGGEESSARSMSYSDTHGLEMWIHT